MSATPGSSSLDHRGLRLIEVDVDPPVTSERRRWPCPLCGRFTELEQMRSTEVAGGPGDERRRLLLCVDCIEQ